MKIRIACAWIAVLCLGLLLYSCFGKAPEPSEQITESTTEPAGDTVPTEPEKPVPLRLYIYDEDGDTAGAWEEIARGYAAEGVEVLLWDGTQEASPSIVVQREAPQSCGTDLSGTAAYAQLTSWDWAVRNEGKVCAIATEISCFGLLCNTRLLASVYSLSEINSLDKLREVATTLSDAGLTVFAAQEIEDLTAWLAMLPEDGRDFAQLYLQHMGSQVSHEPDAQLQQLLRDEAVFCFGSTDDGALSEDGTIGILPVFLGRDNEQNQTLCAVGSRYISIPDDLPQAQLDAALAFLDYLVVPAEDGTVPLDKLQRLSPFRQTVYAGNALEQQAQTDLAAGKDLLCAKWAEISAPVIQAFRSFAAEPSEESWQEFVNARKE